MLVTILRQRFRWLELLTKCKLSFGFSNNHFVINHLFYSQYVLHITCKCLFYWFVFKYLLKAFGVYEFLLEFFSNGSRGFN